MKGFIEVIAIEIAEAKKTLINIETINKVIDVSTEINIPKINNIPVVHIYRCNSIIEINGINYSCIDTYEEIKQKIKEAQGE